MPTSGSKYAGYTVTQLKAELARKRLSLSGKKQELLERLEAHCSKESEKQTSAEQECPTELAGQKTNRDSVRKDSAPKSPAQVPQGPKDDFKEPASIKVPEKSSHLPNHGIRDLTNEFSGVSEEERRAMRLKRFGLPTDSSQGSIIDSFSSTDDPDKLYSRRIRFGLGQAKDPEEERKRLLRKQRFNPIS